MSPTRHHAAVESFGGTVNRLPLSAVMSRLDPDFVETLGPVSKTPGFAEYEQSQAGSDGWPEAPEPIALFKHKPEGGREVWQIISGGHVLAAGIKLDKRDIPCIFVVKGDIARWCMAISGHALRPPPVSAEDEEEEQLVRRLHHSD